MPSFGVARARRGLLLTDDRGQLVAEFAGAPQAIVAALDRLRRRPDLVLVVDEDTLRAYPDLAHVCSATAALVIVPVDILAAAKALARISDRSARRVAGLLASLPATPGLARFLRRTAPVSATQLTLL
jgi:hypothetical protein